jgi:REP element-mobilizing transposase RayT
MARWWLLTWTTYGTWLPGDPRGSVASVRTKPGPRREHDQPGTPFEPEMPGLHAASERRMKGPPVLLSAEQAEVLLAQFRQTAEYRQWVLLGVAIMANHVHLVVGLPEQTAAETAVRDLKAYGSRALSTQWGRPESGTWWAAGGGSRRWLRSDSAVRGAIEYLRKQPHALVLWLAPSQEPGA